MSLLMSEEKALELGYKPLAYLRDWSFRACDPWHELLLGPTYCTSELLQRNNLLLEDMGVLEIHEGKCNVCTWFVSLDSLVYLLRLVVTICGSLSYHVSHTLSCTILFIHSIPFFLYNNI
jgi:hypothetical protein